MGFESTNESFKAAAADARAVHDGVVAGNITGNITGASATAVFGSTCGSPIGAAAAEISENVAELPRTKENALGIRAFIDSFMADMVGEAVSAAETAEVVADAENQFATAQALTAMSTGAEALADKLELEGQGDVAEFVRIAAKATRKGAKLARRNATDTLTLVDTSEDA